MNNKSDKFIKRFELLEPKKVVGVYNIVPARWAKDKVALSFTSDGSGIKTYAIMLLDTLAAKKDKWLAGANRFYSNRENAYIISLPFAEKFVLVYRASTIKNETIRGSTMDYLMDLYNSTTVPLE